jgi:hypothetical protein
MCPMCIASATSMAICSASCIGIAGPIIAGWRACKSWLTQRSNYRLILRSDKS